MKNPGFCVRVLGLVAGLGLVAATAPAGMIAYESFDYLAGELTGQGSAADPGWEGAWGGVTGGTAAQVLVHGMSYANGDVVVNNNASGKALASSQIISDSLVNRRFTVGTAPDELFVSLLFQTVTPPGNVSFFTQFWLWDNAAGSGNIPSMPHYHSGIVRARSGNGTGSVTSSTSGPDMRNGGVYFLVFRLTKSGSNADRYDTVNVYVNPDSMTLLPAATATAVYDSSKDLVDFFGIRTHTAGPGYAGSDQYIGELRIGTSWDAVVIPEPTTLALAGLAGLVLMARRRWVCRR